MSDQGDALFRAMCEQPWDTGLRLRYADWLQHHGQERWAAFVRYQCRNPTESVGHFQSSQMFDFFDEVGEFDPYDSDWVRKLPQLPGVSWWAPHFKKGFVHDAYFPAATAFLEHAETVFAATPIDSLCLGGLTADTLRQILASPLLSRLECLSLGGNYGDEGVRRLAACPSLTRLKWLFLNEDSCGDAGAVALAGSPHFASVECLYFGEGHRIRDRGALALATTGNLGGVSFLSFKETHRLSRPVVEALWKRFDYLDGWPTPG